MVPQWGGICSGASTAKPGTAAAAGGGQAGAGGGRSVGVSEGEGGSGAREGMW